MKSVVVCESWFGNTRAIVEAVAAELRREGEAVLVSVDDELPDLEELDLLVVGAPTHVHGMSSRTSRTSALEQAKATNLEPGRGVRGWLEQLPEGSGVRAAVFDTRAHKPAVLVGSAARGIVKRLRRHGLELVAPPESFFVVGIDGPLEEGEVERATLWARVLVEALSGGVASRSRAAGVAD